MMLNGPHDVLAAPKIAQLLRRMFASDVLTDDAIIVCESDADGVPTPIGGAAARIYRYGKTYVTIFRLGKEQ